MAREPACIFCKIVHGDIPSAEVLRTEHVVVILDINPVNKGHVLIVPIEHHPSLAELPDELARASAEVLPRLCRAVCNASGAEGLNVIVNVGPVAGQTIDHVHWHVIPRRGDDAVDWPWPHDSYVGDELNQMRFAIERELSGPDD